MTEPLVAAIMLTKDRSAMAARAVRAFREQTYQNKILKIWDTSEYPGFSIPADNPAEFLGLIGGFRANEHMTEDVADCSIGELHNRAIKWSVDVNRLNPDIFIHFDDDDVSHPNRIAEQVAHLQSSGADVVAYDELLFWRDKVPPKVRVNFAAITLGFPDEAFPLPAHLALPSGEAWIFRNQFAAAGTSFCYWRKTWERKPFPDAPKIIAGKNVGASEDYQWIQGLNVAKVSAFGKPYKQESLDFQWPRLICSIHGGNSMPYDNLETSNSWRRAPEFDAYCRERMAL